MTEQQVRDLVGNPTSAQDFKDNAVVLANVTVEEMTGPDGRIKPVKALTYFKDGAAGTITVTVVDGRVYRITGFP